MEITKIEMSEKLWKYMSDIGMRTLAGDYPEDIRKEMEYIVEKYSSSLNIFLFRAFDDNGWDSNFSGLAKLGTRKEEPIEVLHENLYYRFSYNVTPIFVIKHNYSYLEKILVATALLVECEKKHRFIPEYMISKASKESDLSEDTCRKIRSLIQGSLSRIGIFNSPVIF